MTRTCPSCSAEATAGSFCAQCGAAMATPGQCPSCAAVLPPGARFCNQCGAAAAPIDPGSSGAAAGKPARTGLAAVIPWVVAGVAVGALLAVLILPRLGPSQPEAVPTTAAAPLGDASSVDISSMTPRERADRLFNRVMQSVSTGDSAQALAFLPMALAAYDQVPDLDLDGRYHQAVLHLVGGDAGAALRQAQVILESEPNHLFGLFTAAQAHQALGSRQEALEHYRRFLESYETEIVRDLPEYRDHAQVLPINRTEAERAVAAL